MARFQVLAVNDKKDFCECCGRRGLTKVVWILDTESGEEKHFGSSCAMQPVKGFGVDSEVKAAIRKFEDARKVINVMTYHAYKGAGGTYAGNAQDGWKPTDPALWGAEARRDHSDSPRMSRLSLAEYARHQMRLAANEAHKIGELASPKTWRGAQLSARWWYWSARVSANKNEQLQYAKNQYALSRHMRDNPSYYAKRPQNKTAWQWFQLDREANEKEKARQHGQTQCREGESEIREHPDSGYF